MPGVQAGGADLPPAAAISLWRLINRPQEIDRHAVRLACLAFLVAYSVILVARYEATHRFLWLRLAVCAYAIFGMWLSRHMTWTRARAYTIGLALFLPLQAGYIDGVLGNHLSEVALTALATFAPLVFVHAGWDFVLVNIALLIGHGTLLAILPEPAVTLPTAAVVLGGALASGSIAGLMTLIYRARWSASVAELSASEARFRSLSAMSPTGIFQTDARGRNVYTNERWGKITGLAREEGLGDGWMRAVHPADRDALAREWAAAVAEGRGEGAGEFRVLTPQGELRWVQVRTQLMRGADGRPIGHVGTVEDVTERKNGDAIREEEAYTSAALARVARELISSLETPKLLERLCELTTDVLGCDFSLTWLWQPEEGLYRVISSHGWPAGAPCALRPPADAPHPLIARLARDEVVQARPSSAEYPLTARLLAEQGCTLVLCIALRRGGEVIGLQVAGYRDRVEAFTPAQERIGRGIGQLASMALTNARLVEELERASRLKSEFVSTMSHELRTPLNVILGYTDMLAEEVEAAEPASMLAQVRRSSLELLEMIEATLDLNRIAAGKDAPRFEPVSVQGLWDELGGEFGALPPRQALTLRWEPADGIELHTDRRKLKTVLKNLIGNALKFTSEGEIVVSCRRAGASCLFTVRDPGVGIPREHLPLIFEMFRQVDSSDRRSYGGAGLGLYIVCRLLDQLGGEITVESEPGRGSTFMVTLPLRADAARAGGAAGPASGAAPLSSSA